MVDKVKLDPNAGQDVDVVFEDDSNQEAEVPTEATSTNSESNPTPDAASDTPADAPTDEEQEALEAAGVNIDEAEQNKVRKREHKALMKDLKEYGTLYGGGKISMINLAERVTEAAQRKAISFSDAELVYDTFHKAAEAKGQVEDGGVVPDVAIEENAKAETNEDSRKAQIKKIGHFIELGNKFDETAYDLIRRTRNIHLELLGKDRSTLKKGSTYTILVDVARNNKTRKESQGVMTDKELHDFLYVAPKPETIPADEWKKVMDALDSAEAAKRGGRGDGARKPITSDTVAGSHLDKAIWELRACLGVGAPERLKAIDDEAAEAQRKIDQAAADKASKAKKAA